MIRIIGFCLCQLFKGNLLGLLDFVQSPWNFALPTLQIFNQEFGIVVGSVHYSFYGSGKGVQFFFPFLQTFIQEELIIEFECLTEGGRFEQKPDISNIEGFETQLQSRFGFFVWMIEGSYGDVFSFGNPVKVVVVELTHFSAFAFFLLKELLLHKFKTSFIKQFLTFIRSFRFFLRFFLHMLQHHPLVLRKLLQLDICDFQIVHKLVEKNIEVYLVGLPFSLFLHNFLHFVRERQRSKVLRKIIKHGEIFLARHKNWQQQQQVIRRKPKMHGNQKPSREKLFYPPPFNPLLIQYLQFFYYLSLSYFIVHFLFHALPHFFQPNFAAVVKVFFCISLTLSFALNGGGWAERARKKKIKR